MAIRLSKSQLSIIFTPEPERKYKNKKITVDGIKYDSIKEYERHKELISFQNQNKISNLRFHCKADNIILIDNPKVVYEPDFCYSENGMNIVEDVKGYITRDFKIKKKIIYSMILSGKLNVTFRITKKHDKLFFIEEEFPKKNNKKV